MLASKVSTLKLKEEETGIVKSVRARRYVPPVIASESVARLEVKTIDLIRLMESAAEVGAVKDVWYSMI